MKYLVTQIAIGTLLLLWPQAISAEKLTLDSGLLSPVTLIRPATGGILIANSNGLFRVRYGTGGVVDMISPLRFRTASLDGRYWGGENKIFRWDGELGLAELRAVDGVQLVARGSKEAVWALSNWMAVRVDQDSVVRFPDWGLTLDAFDGKQRIAGRCAEGVVWGHWGNAQLDTLAGSLDWVVNTMQFDRQGNLWVGTNSGLYVAQPGHREVQCILPDESISQVVIGPTGVWAGTDKGLIWNMERDKWSIQAEVGAVVRSLALDTYGWIWVGTQSSELHRIPSAGPAETIPRNSLSGIEVILQHRSTWIATAKGLFEWAPGTDAPVRHREVPGQLVSALMVQEDMLLAALPGIGLWGVDLTQPSAIAYPIISDPDFPALTHLTRMGSGSLAGASADGFFEISLLRKTISPLLKAPLPISFSNGATMATDPKDGLWILSRKEMVQIVDGHVEDHWEYHLRSMPLHVQFTKAGHLWMVTAEGELLQWNGKRVRKYGKQEGVGESIAEGMTVAEGRLIIVMGRRLAVFDEKEDFFFPVHCPAGFRLSPTVTADSSVLVVDTDKGLLRFPRKKNRLGMGSFEGLISWQGGDSLVSDQLKKLYSPLNDLTLSPIWIDPYAACQPQFQAWMEGLEDGWSLPQDSLEFLYSHLYPGEYTFHLRVITERGFFELKPERILVTHWTENPFYSTLIAFSILVLVVIMFLVRTRFLKRQRERLYKQVEIATGELQKSNVKLLKTHHQLREVLSQEQGFTHAFAMASPDIVLTLSRAGKISYFPEYQAPHVIAWLEANQDVRLVDLVDDRFQTPLREMLEEAEAEQVVATVEIMFNDFQTQKWFEIRAIWMGVRDEMLVLIRDVTYRKEQEQFRAEKAQSMKEAAFEASKTEAQAISSLLHDEVCARLSGLALRLALLRKEVEQQAPDLSPGLSLLEMENNLGLVRDTIRGISHRVSMQAKDKSLKRDLPQIFEQFREKNSLAKYGVQVQDVIRGDESILSPMQRNYIFLSIVQLVTNAITHAKATHILYQIIITPAETSIFVTDNGQGMNVPDFQTLAQDPRPAGLGIVSVYRRVESLGGTLECTSSFQKGTAFSITIPLSDDLSSGPPSDPSRRPLL